MASWVPAGLGKPALWVSWALQKVVWFKLFCQYHSLGRLPSLGSGPSAARQYWGVTSSRGLTWGGQATAWSPSWGPGRRKPWQGSPKNQQMGFTGVPIFGCLPSTRNKWFVCVKWRSCGDQQRRLQAFNRQSSKMRTASPFSSTNTKAMCVGEWGGVGRIRKPDHPLKPSK